MSHGIFGISRKEVHEVYVFTLYSGMLIYINTNNVIDVLFHRSFHKLKTSIMTDEPQVTVTVAYSANLVGIRWVKKQLKL